MQHFLKVADVDVTPLLAELDSHPELWDQHTRRKTAPGSAHTKMSDIWVRYNDVTAYAAADDYSGFNDEHVPVWYPAYAALPALRPIIKKIMAVAAGEMLGGVLITRIPPGLGIDPHADKSWHVDYFEKFYVSLRSAPGAVFGCDHDGVREELKPKPGEVWLFDNHKLHWVRNDSAEDRITLIVCVRRLP